MKQCIELIYNWEFAWSMYAGAERDILGTAMYDDAAKWRPATVPGNVQSDLFKLGILEDPYYADNTDHYRWIEEADFWYRVKTPQFEIKEQQQAILNFAGLDCFATIWINGKQVGSCQNMFIPYRLDVTNLLSSKGGDEIVIRLASTTDEPVVSHRDPNDYPPLRRTRTRKAQMSYAWDIAPRLVTVGIWRPVTLEIIDKVSVLHAGARTLAIKDDVAKMEFVATVDWHCQPQETTISVNFMGQTLSEKVELCGGINDVVIPFEIKNPNLWWPRGEGEQHLYEFTFTVGEELDFKKGKFGVCLIETEEKPREDGGLTFCFKINSRKIFIKGFNWTPSDALFAQSDNRVEKLVDIAAAANANMLRVWGGGIYEKESFLDLCDERGLLVWQDFMFACSRYPQDNAFVATVKEEVTSVVRAYRGHVSLAAWAGDNENDALFSPEAGSLLSREHIPAVLAKLDPKRIYLPSSPFSKLGEDPNDKRFGDAHLWRHTTRHDDPFYYEPAPNLVSEIGKISFPSQKTIDSFMPKEQQWPLDSPLWNFHGSDNVRWGVFRNIKHILQGLKAYGIPELKTLNEVIETTQQIQAEACVFWIEKYASYPNNGGIIIWNLCDCWPQVSDAVISYDLEPKLAYYAISKAFANITKRL
jgi:beta-mannosidase